MLVPTDPGSLGLSAQRLERVTHWLQYQVDSQRLAGCSVVVGRRGQIALAAAAGFLISKPVSRLRSTVWCVFIL